MEEIKAFLSGRDDDLRPLYESARKAKRRCIFVGTTNEGEYLRDDTGGRRFWPILVTKEIDIEGVLGFAESVILNARRMWTEGTLEQRQRLQKVVFPKGVTYSNLAGFGTVETSLFFRWLAVVREKKYALASPTGFEPKQANYTDDAEVQDVIDISKLKKAEG